LNLLKLVKTGKMATGRLSKTVGAMLPAFQKRIIHWQSICRISKALGASPRHRCPVVAKDLNSPVLKSFQQIQKLLPQNGSELINSV
jgi:hypothetical protein